MTHSLRSILMTALLLGVCVVFVATFLSVRAATAITEAQLTLSTFERSKTASATLTFTTPVTIPSDGVIRVVFPGTMSTSSLVTVTDPQDTIDADVEVVPVSSGIEVRRLGNGNPIAAGTVLTGLILSSIQTPVSEGFGGTYELSVRTAGGSVLAEATLSQDYFTNDVTLNATPTTVTLLAPNGAETWRNGETKTIIWEGTGSDIASVDILLSVDGGTTYTQTIAIDQPPSGQLQWVVDAPPAAMAYVKLVGKSDIGTRFISDYSNASFSIGVAIPVQQESVEMSEESVESPYALRRIKGAGFSTVYFVARDGKRYLFPTAAVYGTWYKDFSGIDVLPDKEVAAMPMGKRVKMAPGTLIKIPSVPKVYVVADTQGTIRHVESEALAQAIFGTTWNTQVYDLDETLFGDYQVGEVVNDVGDYTRRDLPSDPYPVTVLME